MTGKIHESTRLPGWVRKLVATLSSGRWPLLAPRRYRLCILKTDRIGDFVLATSAIRLLTQHVGPTNSLLIVSPVVAELARAEFPGCDVLALPGFPGRLLSDFLPQALPLKRRFSRFHCERLVCLRHQRAVNHDLALSWIHADRSYGLKNNDHCRLEVESEFRSFRFDEELPASFDEPASASALCLELRRHQRLVSAVTGSPVSETEILPRLTSAAGTASAPSILVCPFGTQDIRTYPVPALIQALRLVRVTSPLPFLFCGGKDQEPQLRALLAAAVDAGIAEVAIVCPPSISEFIDIVNGAAAVLTAESAGAHIATALDKSTVILLGGGHFGEFAPWRRSDQQHWLTNRLECFGCNWGCSRLEPECLTRLTPMEIARALVCATSRRAP